MLNAPLIVVAEVNIIVPVMAKVKLLKVVAEAESVWFPGAPKITVPVPDVKSDPVPFQAVTLAELSLRVLEPPFNVPADRVTSPVNVWFKPAPRFNVPPLPLIVNPAALIEPCMVAVPAVLVMETDPVVVNPESVWVVIAPEIITGEAFAVKTPELLKLPPKLIE